MMKGLLVALAITIPALATAAIPTQAEVAAAAQRCKIYKDLHQTPERITKSLADYFGKKIFEMRSELGDYANVDILMTQYNAEGRYIFMQVICEIPVPPTPAQVVPK
jgi:hypothetical protein